MAVGKYSPTVAAAYHDNQDWWNQHCENEGDFYDRDGYDEYGYDAHGRGRAGYLEEDYGADEDGEHRLYEEMLSHWAFRYIVR